MPPIINQVIIREKALMVILEKIMEVKKELNAKANKRKQKKKLW